jgi:hypothetical protein
MSIPNTVRTAMLQNPHFVELFRAATYIRTFLTDELDVIERRWPSGTVKVSIREDIENLREIIVLSFEGRPEEFKKPVIEYEIHVFDPITHQKWLDRFVREICDRVIANRN